MKKPKTLFYSQDGEKYFDAVISLGGTCQVAYQLNRLCLRQKSFPYDWLFSCLDDEKFIESIENDFADWLKFENLKIENDDSVEHLRVTDVYYNMIHQHIFPKERPLEESYRDVIRIVQRRIDRFKNLQHKNLNILFVRTNMFKGDAKRLSQLLIEKFGKGAVLIVLNHTKFFEIKSIPVLSNNLFIYEIYDENENTGENWRGYDLHYDRIFRDVRLKEQSFDIKNDSLFTSIYNCEKNQITGNYFRWCTSESKINLLKYGGGILSFSLESVKPVTVVIRDVHGIAFQEHTVSSPKTIQFEITHDKRVVSICAKETWRPCDLFGSDDCRELSVSISNMIIKNNI